VQSLSYENNDVHETEPVRETHFHMNGFARRLVLTEAKGTDWLISQLHKLELA